MAANPPPPLEELIERLRQVLGNLSPEPLSTSIRPVLESFFEQFELVPRRDFDAHLAQLERLEAAVDELKARLAALEADDREP